MPNGERIISDKTLGKHSLISLSGFLRFNEVISEVRADKALSGHTSHLSGGLIHVGDFALGTDGNQRIETSLNQAAGILGGVTQLFLSLLLFRVVVAHQQVST